MPLFERVLLWSTAPDLAEPSPPPPPEPPSDDRRLEACITPSLPKPPSSFTMPLFERVLLWSTAPDFSGRFWLPLLPLCFFAMLVNSHNYVISFL